MIRTRSFQLTFAGLLSVVALSTDLGGQRAAEPPPPALASFAEPAISPDGRELAVVSSGDIWTVPAAGGDARLLVAHEANESRPMYSPDGAKLAFISDRTGGGDIYVLTLATGALARLTFDDGLDRLDGWSRDGEWIYFSSSSSDIAGMHDIFRVRAYRRDADGSLRGSLHQRVLRRAVARRTRIAFSARGNGAGQWWRNGSSHLDESELWLLDFTNGGQQPKYEQLTERGAKQLWPMWSGDGKSLFYVSDRGGRSEHLDAAARRRCRGRSRASPTAACCGRRSRPTARTIAFERDFEVWTLDTASGRASQVAIARRGLPAGPAVEHLTLNNGFSDLALSPDGRKVAFAARGEIWAASARDGGDAVRVTRTLRARSADRLAPRQPAHRLRLGARRRVAPVPLRLHDQLVRRS